MAVMAVSMDEYAVIIIARMPGRISLARRNTSMPVISGSLRSRIRISKSWAAMAAIASAPFEAALTLWPSSSKASDSTTCIFTSSSTINTRPQQDGPSPEVAVTNTPAPESVIIVPITWSFFRLHRISFPIHAPTYHAGNLLLRRCRRSPPLSTLVGLPAPSRPGQLCRRRLSASALRSHRLSPAPKAPD